MNEEMNNEAAPAETPVAEAPAANAADKVSGITGKIDSIFDKAVSFVGDRPWEEWLAAANGFIGKFLPLVIAVTGVLAFLVGVVAAVRHDARISQLFMMFGILVGTVFAVHLAPKAMALPRSLVEKRAPDAIRPELLSLFKVILGIGFLVIAVFLLLQFNESAFYGAIAFAVAGLVHIIVYSRPALIGLKAGYPENAAGEAITLILLPVKIVLALLTIAVCLGTIVLAVKGIVSLFGEYTYGEEASMTLVTATFFPVMLPLAVYFGYLSMVFVLDLYRAIVALPGKMDDLRKAVESK